MSKTVCGKNLTKKVRVQSLEEFRSPEDMQRLMSLRRNCKEGEKKNKMSSHDRKLEKRVSEKGGIQTHC